ncbi:MAG TPA: ABC transporter ATP-binding protein [Azospirillaceae bacterium]|nr:ABC transporter ATP-binding protein [Azospirillaceae bacterium]
MEDIVENPVIRVRNLVTRFGPQVVHEGVNLDVRRGEVLGLVGGSGMGKSVLLKEIVGLIEPTGGTIEVLGRDTGRQGRAGLQERWGVLFQDGALFSSMTVAENIMVPLREHTTLPDDIIREIARVKVAMVGLPANAAAKYPSQLSGGMRKRAGLARALALDPEILFLDEPTAGLDPIGAAAFDELIGNLQRSLGLTVFMVTHDLDSLYAICDRIAVLIDRRLLVGTIDDLLQADHPWIRDYFHGPRGRAAASSRS